MSFTIKLAMIVRNEERALTSAAPYVDEMVVIDTGSQDATVEIAGSHAARIEHFPWCDDFSAARNHALAVARADWVFMLDADEWLVEGGRELEHLRARRPRDLGVAQVASTFAIGDRTETQVSRIVRVLPRGARFEGRIHEQPVFSTARFNLALVIAHDGYEPEQRQAKAGRNERLLRLALSDAHDDPYLRYQLGRDLETQGRFAEAVGEYVVALSADPRDAWRHDLDARAIYSMKMTGRFQEGLELAEDALERWPSSPDIPFALGDLLLDVANTEPSSAGQLLPLIEGAWVRCLEIGDGSGLPGAVAGRGGHLAAANLAAFHEALGNPDEAARYRTLADKLQSSVSQS